MLEERRSRPKKKEEAWKKTEEEARKRWWWWPGGPMRAKAPRMSGLRGSSHPRVVQGISLLLLAFVEWLAVNICWTYVNNWTWYHNAWHMIELYIATVLICEL
jgi:hypothetical protein